ncbi:MAG: ABC transporter ATP-binding protein [Planctomycetes bacterium]|nr:ABC transporter ATP-binding protein [Planctomycetota bacterium]
MTSLAAVAVSKSFGAKRALDDVSFAVEAGEIVALVGENGAGKSTLLKVVSGFLRPDSGEVRIDGKSVQMRGPRDAAARGIGLVHQHFMLIPELTVAENVVLGREPGAGLLLDIAAAEREVQDCAERFGLALDPSARVGDLGVAQQQRVELLKVLVRGARVLLLDEPTGLLPPSGVKDLFALVRRLAAEGCGVVLVTHKLREVTDVCSRAAVLRQGRLAGERRITGDASAVETDLARLMVGDDLDLRRRATAPRGAARGAALVEVESLTVAGPGGRALVDGATFSLRAGEVTGLAGVAGNGQVELLEAIAGVRPCAAAKLMVAGADLRRLGVAARRRAGVGYVPEDRLRDGLAPELSVAENVVLPSTRRWARAMSGWLDRAGIRKAGEEAVAQHDVRPPDPSAAVGGLSGGNQQKVLLARELRARPKLLLAAEPAHGLDFRATEAVHRNLRAAADAGGAVLVASTDLAELLALCDRIVVVCGGRITGEVDPRATSEDELGLLMAGAGRSG